MPLTRKALLAGSWYPADALACREAIAQWDEAVPKAPKRALIAPHAGFRYSGRCAARGFGALGASPELVVVFGSHRGAHGPNTIFLGDTWETPLGPLDNDRQLAQRVATELGLEAEPLAPARPDNGIELLLPFVRYFFARARLLALGVAAGASALAIGTTVGNVCRGRDTVFVGSTDLTHYGPNYEFTPHGTGAAAVNWARKNDQGFIDRLLATDAAGALRHGVEAHSACCPGAAAATLTALAAYGTAAAPALVEHYTSYDIAPSDSFVGYASVVA